MDLILTVLAVIPAAILLVYIYRKDTVEHEPAGLLALLFLGGCLSIIPTMICELVAESFLVSLFGGASVLYAFLENFFGVALIEEGWKLVFLALIAWRSRHFDHLFDGLVYAVFVSLGFALVENIMYVLSQESISEALEVAGMRALLSVPLHAFCGVIMGFYFGQAKKAAVENNQDVKKRNLVLSLVVPMAVHGFYDFCLSVDSLLLELGFFVFVIGLYVFAFNRVRTSSKSDQAFAGFSAGAPVYNPAATSTMGETAPVETWNAPANPVPQPMASPLPQATTTWYCPNCGTPNTRKFCTNCGKPYLS